MGQLYLSFDPQSPSDIWPGTQWEKIAGYFLRAANDTSTGGSDTATLTLSQLPKWSASIGVRPGSNDTVLGTWASAGSVSQSTVQDTSATSFTSQARSCHPAKLEFHFGNNESHNNMPKYQDVHAWRRTA